MPAVPSRAAWTLPAEPATVATVRVGIRDFAAAHGAPGDVVADIALAVSELVTNAIVHGITRAGGDIALHVAVADDIVRVEVCDPGPGFSPGEPPASGETGWGLRLVDGLVECWGVAPDDPHCVWVEVGASPGDDED
jgi:anti-sigma regulatory factor (Ser/Thr protein kinase)